MLLDGPPAYDDLGAPFDDRANQVRDAVPAVLVVRVGVDDDIGAEFDGALQTRREAGGKAFVPGEAEDVLGAGGTGVSDGVIYAAIVDDEDFDLIDAGDSAGDIRDGRGDGLFLVVARYLDDELHRASPPGPRIRSS